MSPPMRDRAAAMWIRHHCASRTLRWLFGLICRGCGGCPRRPSSIHWNWACDTLTQHAAYLSASPVIGQTELGSPPSSVGSATATTEGIAARVGFITSAVSYAAIALFAPGPPARRRDRERGGVVGLARTVDRLVPDHARLAVTMTVRRPTVARECVRIEIQGLKGVLASETRPAGTGVSRPEAAVVPD